MNSEFCFFFKWYLLACVFFLLILFSNEVLIIYHLLLPLTGKRAAILCIIAQSNRIAQMNAYKQTITQRTHIQRAVSRTHALNAAKYTNSIVVDAPYKYTSLLRCYAQFQCFQAADGEYIRHSHIFSVSFCFYFFFINIFCSTIRIFISFYGEFIDSQVILL